MDYKNINISIVLFLILLIFISGCGEKFKYEENKMEDEFSNSKEKNIQTEETIVEESENVCDFNCTLDLVKKNNDLNLCFELNENNKCLNLSFSENVTYEVNFCDSIEDIDVKDSCLKTYIEKNVKSKGNSYLIDICKKLNGSKDECIINIAKEKNYKSACLEIKEIDKQIYCYEVVGSDKCYDSDDSKESNDILGFACVNGNCVKDYCIMSRYREQYCKDNEIKEFSFDCENGCYDGVCNKGIYGDEFKLALGNPNFYDNEFSTFLYIFDGTKKLDVSKLVIEFIYGKNIEKKTYSKSKSLTTFSVNPISWNEDEPVIETQLDLENNLYRQIRTRLETVPKEGDECLIKFSYGTESIGFIIRANEEGGKYQIVQEIFDKNLLKETITEFESREVLGIDYSQIEKQAKIDAQECEKALESGFNKEFDKKCSDVESISCVFIDTCRDGILTSIVSCSSDYFESDKYEFKDFC